MILILVLALCLSTAQADDADELRQACEMAMVKNVMSIFQAKNGGSTKPDLIDAIQKVSKETGYPAQTILDLLDLVYMDNPPQEQVERAMEADVQNCVSYNNRKKIKNHAI